MIFILLTRLIGKEVHPEKLSLENLKTDITKKIATACPEVKWISNYALMGPHDYLDIFSAPDMETAMKVAIIVREYGHAATEIWPALEWKGFEKIISTKGTKKKKQ